MRRSETFSQRVRTSYRSTKPYMQARPQKAEDYGLPALNRALEGVTGTTAVHICFGYAAIIHERPSGYSFLSQLKNCPCRQVSIETAQSKLDCSVLSDLGGKKVLLGVIDLSDMNVETAEIVASRIRRALLYVPAKDIIIAPDCGMKYSRAISPSARCGLWSTGRRSSVRKWVDRPLRTPSNARRMCWSR
jgi:methionine synthase II (cobalamin-independent)